MTKISWNCIFLLLLLYQQHSRKEQKIQCCETTREEFQRLPPKRSPSWVFPTQEDNSASISVSPWESQTGDGSSQQQHHCLCIKVFPHQPTLCWSEQNKKHERSVSIVTTEPATIRQVKQKPHDQNQGTFKVIKLSLFLKQVIENTPEAEHWKLICYNGKNKIKS